ncbi:MAG: LysR substrate-binding domain-containing protein [Candidatus Sulfopaludibacter sp.]|nr:LysR substrate-binding domain-containing protein [Candidatus Sulfopaludibacter sp.]
MVLENFRLRVFRAVAEHLSFRKAGEALYLTQPAVTLQIKALEEELGTKVFERSASGVHLTEAGKVLLECAGQMHQLAEEAEGRMASLKGEAAGDLVLGASTTIAQYVLPALLADFSRAYPGIRLRVFSGNTEHVAEGVATARFGLGLIEGPAKRRDLRVQPWFDDELLLVVPADHEWAGLGTVAPEALAGAPLVIRELGSGSRHILESGLQKAGIRLGSLRIVMELDSTEAILSCIEAGLGVGFVSEWALVRRSDTGRLATLRLSGGKMCRTFGLVSGQGPELQPSATILLRFLLDRVPPRPRRTKMKLAADG